MKKIALLTIISSFFVASFVFAESQFTTSRTVLGPDGIASTTTTTKSDSENIWETEKLKMEEAKEAYQQKMEELRTANNERKQLLKTELLSRAKERAKKAIERVVVKFGRIKSRVDRMKSISDEKKDGIKTLIDGQIALLEGQKTNVENAITSADLKAVMSETRASVKQSIRTVKEAIKTSRDINLRNVANSLQSALDRMKIKITALKATGEDVTDLESLATKIQTEIDQAKADILANDQTKAKAGLILAKEDLKKLKNQIEALREDDETSSTTTSTKEEE